MMPLLKKVGRWALRRASEGSTLTGVGILVGGVVAKKLGIPEGDAVQMVTTVLGSVLAAATTKNHTPLRDQ